MMHTLNFNIYCYWSNSLTLSMRNSNTDRWLKHHYQEQECGTIVKTKHNSRTRQRMERLRDEIERKKKESIGIRKSVFDLIKNVGGVWAIGERRDRGRRGQGLVFHFQLFQLVIVWVWDRCNLPKTQHRRPSVCASNVASSAGKSHKTCHEHAWVIVHSKIKRNK